MRVLAAGAALKGTVDCLAAARALGEGARAAGATPHILPIADGGDGSLLALEGAGFSLLPASCRDALGRPVQALFGWHAPSRTAAVEFAQAAGIARLGDHPGDPWLRSSYGVGELIAVALDRNPRRLVVLLGGSATQDAGLGLLQALGARLDGVASALAAASDLAILQGADLRPALRRLRGVRLEIATDVAHRLSGSGGSAHSFAAQKGFRPAEIGPLDDAIVHAGEVLARASGRPLDVPGAGAAGGVGAALLALGGRLRPGADLILDLLHFDAALAGAGLLLTTEGRADRTTWAGKAPAAAARRALAAGIPAVLIAGSLGPGADPGLPGLHVLAARPEGGTAGPAEIAETARAALQAAMGV